MSTATSHTDRLREPWRQASRDAEAGFANRSDGLRETRRQATRATEGVNISSERVNISSARVNISSESSQHFQEGVSTFSVRKVITITLTLTEMYTLSDGRRGGRKFLLYINIYNNFL